MNILYWTLWVVLRRVATMTSISNPNTYLSIVSISYSVVILSCSAVIAFILLFDFIPSLTREVNSQRTILSAQQQPKQQPKHGEMTSLHKDSSSHQTPKKIKKNPFIIQNLKSPFRPLWNMDRPLFFRMEMMLYLIMFVFLIIQEGLGLYVMNSRSNGDENSLMNNIFTQMQFLFEILYSLSYLMVFGGFACGVTLYYRIQKRRKQRNHSEAHDGNNGRRHDMNSSEDENDLLNLLADERASELFERFCAKEFSVENLYAWKYLHRCKEKLFGQDLAIITEIVLTLNDLYIQSGSDYELNIPSSLKSQFKVMRLALQEASSFDTTKH